MRAFIGVPLFTAGTQTTAPRHSLRTDRRHDWRKGRLLVAATARPPPGDPGSGRCDWRDSCTKLQPAYPPQARVTHDRPRVQTRQQVGMGCCAGRAAGFRPLHAGLCPRRQRLLSARDAMA
jgi:hypothetical protein